MQHAVPMHRIYIVYSAHARELMPSVACTWKCMHRAHATIHGTKGYIVTRFVAIVSTFVAAIILYAQYVDIPY